MTLVAPYIRVSIAQLISYKQKKENRDSEASSIYIETEDKKRQITAAWQRKQATQKRKRR